MTSAIFVDTFTRDLRVSVVSVTRALTGLVIRFGGSVGSLWDLTKNDKGRFKADLPVLVAHRGYAAMSSNGHVTVIGGNDLPKDRIVGIQGMPWMKGTGSLRACKRAIEVSVLVSPEVWLIKTHAHKGEVAWHSYMTWGHSNRATASAAKAAMEIRAKIRPEPLLILEGQSDYTGAWQFRPDLEVALEDFPAEHREDVFAQKNEEKVEEVPPTTEE